MRLTWIVAMLLGAAVSGASAQQGQTAVAADNSRENAVIRRTASTADDQPNDRADRLMVAQVRRAIVKDKSLSFYGHNVKIIVAHGHITLEGPVFSADEREQVAWDVARIVPSTAIVNRLTVV